MKKNKIITNEKSFDEMQENEIVIELLGMEIEKLKEELNASNIDVKFYKEQIKEQTEAINNLTQILLSL